jgi:protease-4
MAFETETVLDRRRLRRRLSWWRALAVVAALALIGVAALSTRDGAVFGRKQIARVSLEGLITEDRDQLRMLQKIAKSDRVAAVIVFVNSPGGTTTGGEALFDALRKLAAVKPVVAQFGTVATSAAYIAGLATDQIVARGNTITGSVGVIFQWAEFSQLLDKVGVKVNEVKSGPLKANPSPFQPLDAEGKAVAEQMVSESQKWFVGLVASRRHIDPKSVTGLEQGRIFSGREALTYKLVDQIGGEAEAIKYLEEVRHIPTGLKVVDWKPKREDGWGLTSLATRAIGTLINLRGQGGLVGVLAPGVRTLQLDGLVSIWHGSEN